MDQYAVVKYPPAKPDTEYTAPAEVKRVKYLAFEDCVKLKGVTLGTNIENVEHGAFAGCKNLGSINLDGENTYLALEDGILYDKKKTKLLVCPAGKAEFALNIPNTVKNIQGYAFSGCNNFGTSINLENIEEIGIRAFEKCIKLESVVLGNKITLLFPGAFEDCLNLKSIEFGNKVSEIYWRAFANCPSLKSLNLPASVVKIDKYAFAESWNLDTVQFESGSKYSFRSGAICTDNGETLYMFLPGAGTEDYVLPKGIKTIDETAFYCNPNLTSITMPDMITMKWRAFEKCNRLTSVVMPSVVDLESGAFTDCVLLESVTIPPGLEPNFNPFHGCAFLKNFNTGENPAFVSDKGVLYSDGGKTLYYYNGDDGGEFTIPDGVTAIGAGAFANCTSPTKINIPASVTKIGKSAFSNCHSLKEFTIPSGVTSVESFAFSACTSLVYIDLHPGITSVDEGAFYRCVSLTGIAIPEGVTSLGEYALEDCHSLVSVSLPKSLTSIGKECFQNSESLENVRIPAGVTEFGEKAFNGICKKTFILESNLQNTASLRDWTFFGAPVDLFVFDTEDSFTIEDNMKRDGKSLIFTGKTANVKISVEDMMPSSGHNPAYFECKDGKWVKNHIKPVGVPDESVIYDGKPRKWETDLGFSVTYSDSGTDVGTYTSVLKPGLSSFYWQGGVKGTRHFVWRILPFDASGLDVEGVGDMAYAGSPLEPKPVVKRGETALVLDKDYKLSYSNNDGVG